MNNKRVPLQSQFKKVKDLEELKWSSVTHGLNYANKSAILINEKDDIYVYDVPNFHLRHMIKLTSSITAIGLAHNKYIILALDSGLLQCYEENITFKLQKIKE